MEYNIWRVCERFHMHPPGVAQNWDACNLEIQCALLAYEEGRQDEEIREKAALAGAKI